MANTLCQFFYPSLYRGSTVSRIETDFRCQNKDSFEFNNHLIIILKPINLSCGKALMPNRTYLYENIYIYISIIVIFLDFHSTKQGLPLVDSWSRGLD